MQQRLKHRILSWGLGVLPTTGFAISLTAGFAITIFTLELPNAAHAQSSQKSSSAQALNS